MLMLHSRFLIGNFRWNDMPLGVGACRIRAVYDTESEYKLNGALRWMSIFHAPHTIMALYAWLCRMHPLFIFKDDYIPATHQPTNFREFDSSENRHRRRTNLTLVFILIALSERFVNNTAGEWMASPSAPHHFRVQVNVWLRVRLQLREYSLYSTHTHTSMRIHSSLIECSSNSFGCWKQFLCIRYAMRSFRIIIIISTNCSHYNFECSDAVSRSITG